MTDEHTAVNNDVFSPDLLASPDKLGCCRQHSILSYPFFSLQLFRVRTRTQEAEDEQTQERFFRPHFLQAPGDMLAHEGKLCRLDCKVGVVLNLARRNTGIPPDLAFDFRR